MNSIIFSGCSLTWGEGLWRESPNCKNDQIGLKYQYDNRWATKVAKHFNKEAVVKAHNGGNILSSIQFVKKEIDANSWNELNTEMVIFQTTQFKRVTDSVSYQVEELEKLVEYVENLGIKIRFIHWMWPDITSFEIKFLSNSLKNANEKLSSKIIRDRTIYILNRFNFDKMIDQSTYKVIGSDANKYTLAAKFNCKDFHMNQEGHDVLANEIINYIEKNKLL